MRDQIDAVIEEAQSQAIAGHRRPPVPLSHTPTSSSKSSKTLSPSATVAASLLRSAAAEAASIHGLGTLSPGRGLEADDDDDDGVPALSAFKKEGLYQREAAPLADGSATTTTAAIGSKIDHGGIGPNGEWLEFRDPSNGSVYYVNMISGTAPTTPPSLVHPLTCQHNTTQLLQSKHSVKHSVNPSCQPILSYHHIKIPYQHAPSSHPSTYPVISPYQRTLPHQNTQGTSEASILRMLASRP